MCLPNLPPGRIRSSSTDARRGHAWDTYTTISLALPMIVHIGVYVNTKMKESYQRPCPAKKKRWADCFFSIGIHKAYSTETETVIPAKTSKFPAVSSNYRDHEPNVRQNESHAHKNGYCGYVTISHQGNEYPLCQASSTFLPLNGIKALF